MKTNVPMVHLFVDIEEDLKKEVKILAAREGKTVKEIVISQLMSYVKEHKEGNPQHELTKFIENEDFLGFPSIATDYNTKITYIEKHMQKDGRLTQMGKELWGHILQWQKELQKY